MPKPSITFVLADIAVECTTPGCRNEAVVRMETHRSRSRGWLCADHAGVAFLRWIKRENGHRRLEWMRAEYQRVLMDEEDGQD
jgi:hypothetical protein